MPKTYKKGWFIFESSLSIYAYIHMLYSSFPLWAYRYMHRYDIMCTKLESCSVVILHTNLNKDETKNLEASRTEMTESLLPHKHLCYWERKIQQNYLKQTEFVRVQIQKTLDDVLIVTRYCSIKIGFQNIHWWIHTPIFKWQNFTVSQGIYVNSGKNINDNKITFISNISQW